MAQRKPKAAAGAKKAAPSKKASKAPRKRRRAKAPAVTVLGGGNWGTAIAQLIAANGHAVRLWCRRAEQADEINTCRTNERYLPGATLHDGIEATSDLAAAVTGVPVLIYVIPSKSFRAVARATGDVVQPDQLAIHATKGIEAESFCRMSELLTQETCLRQIGVLSGPNIAVEICAGKPAGTVIASRFPRVIEQCQRLLASPQMRVYGNDDVVGVELGGALKNIIAIAAGMLAELDLGENARSLLITRGLSEIARVGVALGAQPLTFSGLAGIGDLMVTCASPHSRNHRVGRGLARGDKLDAVVEQLGMVAEGVHTAAVVHTINEQRGIDAPLMEAVYRIVHEGLHPAEAVRELMVTASRPDIATDLVRR